MTPQLNPLQLQALTAALSNLNQAPGQMTLGQSLTEASQANPVDTRTQMAGKVAIPNSPVNALAQGLNGAVRGLGINQTQAGLAQQAQGRAQVQQMIANLLRNGAGSGTGGAAPPATAPSVPWDQELTPD